MAESKHCIESPAAKHNYFPVYELNADQSTKAIIIVCAQCGHSKELRASDHTDGE